MEAPHATRTPGGPTAPSPAAGFALIAVITMMSLVVVLTLGLLALSLSATRQQSAVRDMAMAQSNAQLAMSMAIADLQKFAGPDQRVTATADIAGDTSGDRLASGKQPLNNKSIEGIEKGLSSVQPGTRYWTGVWQNSAAPEQIYTKTPSPTLVQWLVSGNGGRSAQPAVAPDSPSVAVKPDGQVGKDTALLVGSGSVGRAGSSENVERYVSAPVVTIPAPPSSAYQTLGRFAWWVGDEGVKARINLVQSAKDSTRYSSLTAQRRGWETVDGFSAYPTPSSPMHALLPRVVTMPEAALLVPGVEDAGANASPLQAIFHAATTDSMGVLADSLGGGSRVDLSAVFSSSLASSSRVKSMLNYPVKGKTVIPNMTLNKDMIAPTWNTMKDFYDRYASLDGGSLVVKAPTSQADTGIAPAVIDFRILMGVRFVNTGAGFKANPCGKMAVTLANPYSVPLKWDRDIEFEVRNQTPPGNRPSRIWNLGTNSVYIPSSDNAAESAVFNKTIFVLKPSSLAPGEAQAYTVAGYLLRPLGSGGQRFTVNLAPFDSSAPFSFSNCVEQDTTTVYTSFPSLDVRESWQTTLVMLDITLSGSSGFPLKRIERFELDNGYFSPNSKTFTMTDVTNTILPVPLMGYNFQISRPGFNYLNLMPNGYSMGQRASTLRTFMDFNLQANRIGKPIASYNPPPYFMQSNDSIALLPTNPPGGETGSGFVDNLPRSAMPWGRDPRGAGKTVLFSVPSQFSSLAEFQHADLTGDDVAASIGHQPGHAFGNSYATPFVKRNLTAQSKGTKAPRYDYELIGSNNHTGANQFERSYYDISYLLNAAVWDSFFFSTVRSGTRPENPSMVFFDATESTANLQDPVLAANHLMMAGSFNVNCSEKNAWKAFLGSARYFKHTADAGKEATAAFPRSLEQISPSATPPTGTEADSFSGYRRLSDDELEQLSTEIVRQVRLRGPFVSLSHFVNRALADLNKEPALTRAGALQVAIDESGATINFAGNKKALSGVDAKEDRVTLMEKEGAPRADLDGGDRGDRPSDATSVPDWAMTSTDNNFGTVASIIADRTMLASTQAEQGYRSTGIPGWLTQADVLQVIGPSLSARSDTFRIRTFGEAVDRTGKTVARAYCEVIVQRVPWYLDAKDNPSLRGTELSTINKRYGRRFQIVSFRWLSPQEI